MKRIQKPRIERIITSVTSVYIKHASICRCIIHIGCWTFLMFFGTTVNAQDETDQPIGALADIADKKKLTVLIEVQQYESVFEKGLTYFKQKHYNEAITQYIHSLDYLLGTDNVTQKKRGDTYTKIAESYKRIKHREKTAEFYKKALDVYTNINNEKYMARTLNTLAEAERYLGNLVVALNRSTQSLEIHKKINDPQGYAKALMGAGIIYRHIGRYETSIKHIHQAGLYYKTTNNYRGIAKTSNEIGHLYIRLEQFEQAKYFFQETINIPQEKLGLMTIATALREMAVIDLHQGDFGSALRSAKRALKIYQRENETLKESLTARIIANIYRAKKDNSNAVDYYKKSLLIAIEEGSKSFQIKAQTPLAAILIAQDVDEAVRLLTNSLEISLDIKNDKHTLYIYRTLRQAEDYRGNFSQALSYAKKEIALTRIIQSETDNKNLALTKATLYSHKMEIELEALREITRLNQLELIQKNNEIEIAEQAGLINELELIKNKYASLALAFLLIICIFLVIFIFRQFIASKKHNKELDSLAYRDPLTNCYNRRSLFERMERDFLNADVDNKYSVIMADIDHFKNVNDTHGHSVGDSVIRGFASILEGCIGQDDIVSRFGGEEFCIVLTQTAHDQAMDIAENMRNKIENSHFDKVNVTCSFGVSSRYFNAMTPSGLIEQADLALYKSKSLGRNQVTLWHELLNK